MRERRHPQYRQPQAIAIAATRKAPAALTQALPYALAILASLMLGSFL